MSEPKERRERFSEIQQALDESDRDERLEEDRDMEAMAQMWERVVQRHAYADDT